jgi:hypothetical protein
MALEWSIKKDFLRYIGGLGDGRTTVIAPAVRRANGTFSFPVARDDASASRQSVGGRCLRFDGSVVFEGHGGLLHVVVGEPELELQPDGATGVLGLTDPDWSGRRMRLATFACDLSPAPAEWIGSSVRLTEDGSDLFFRVYGVGDLLDDFTVTSSEGAPGAHPQINR